MRIFVLYSSIIALGLLGLSGMISRSESPDVQLLGAWEEVAWEYEKTDQPGMKQNSSLKAQFLKENAADDLSIHQSERWEFSNNGALCLEAPQGSSTVKWCLKGRGHILQIDKDGRKEYYNIMELNDSSMILNFDLDLEVRGIAKLTFKKKESRNDL